MAGTLTRSGFRAALQGAVLPVLPLLLHAFSGAVSFGEPAASAGRNPTILQEPDGIDWARWVPSIAGPSR